MWLSAGARVPNSRKSLSDPSSPPLYPVSHPHELIVSFDVKHLSQLMVDFWGTSGAGGKSTAACRRYFTALLSAVRGRKFA